MVLHVKRTFFRISCTCRNSVWWKKRNAFIFKQYLQCKSYIHNFKKCNLSFISNIFLSFHYSFIFVLKLSNINVLWNRSFLSYYIKWQRSLWPLSLHGWMLCCFYALCTAYRAEQNEDYPIVILCILSGEELSFKEHPLQKFIFIIFSMIMLYISRWEFSEPHDAILHHLSLLYFHPVPFPSNLECQRKDIHDFPLYIYS